MTSFFAGLAPDLRQALLGLGQPLRLAAGEVLVAKGAADADLFVLQSGALQRLSGGDGQLLCQAIRPGEVVGATAFLSAGSQVATVVAAAPSAVLRFDRAATLQALAGTPAQREALLTHLQGLASQRPQAAAGQDSPDPGAVVDALIREALQHRAVQHPYLTALAKGDLPDLQAALADFADHYYGYSAHFPRYLTAVISRLAEPAHRATLLANLTEESGHYDQEDLDLLQACGVQADWIVGIPHPQLFLRFRRALGVDDRDADGDHIEVVCWREMFYGVLISGSPAEAVGALGLGTETIVRSIYRPFVEAIQRVGTLTPAEAVFFPLHTAVDDHHQATLRAIAVDFAATAQGRADLRKGMAKALALRDSFWGWLHERALAQPAAA